MPRIYVGNGDWILVGDGKKALLLINEGDAELLNLRRLSVSMQQSLPTSDQGTDRPGRTFESFGNSRSSYEPTDWHEIDEKAFARSIAETINRAAHAHEIRHLIVIAPPKILGELRNEFTPEVQKIIRAEINKDLTKHSIPEIERLITTYDV